MKDRERSYAGARVLYEVLADRERLARLTESEWDVFLAVADHARLLPRLAIEEQLRLSSLPLPGWVRDRLTSAAIRGRQYERDVCWEIDRIRRALATVDVDPVFLKGAAYIVAGLTCGVGRVVADVDILVAEQDLPRVEAALLTHGWQFEPLDSYDERYYREWMHELPPMRHRERGTMLDVHHRILPRTGRIHPPTDRLLSKVVTAGGARILSPSHRLLHAAAHLFQDGEILGSLRDLTDIASLSGDEAFWKETADEARILGLGRAAYYSVRYASRLSPRAFPDSALAAVAEWAPRRAVRALMDGLVETTLRKGSRMATPAGAALVARSHWLKMPTSLLLPHLWRKAWGRATPV